MLDWEVTHRTPSIFSKYCFTPISVFAFLLVFPVLSFSVLLRPCPCAFLLLCLPAPVPSSCAFLPCAFLLLCLPPPVPSCPCALVPGLQRPPPPLSSRPWRWPWSACASSPLRPAPVPSCPCALVPGLQRPPPFEFQALEVALECVCKLLERKTEELKKEAHEALDKLTSKVRPYMPLPLLSSRPWTSSPPRSNPEYPPVLVPGLGRGHGQDHLQGQRPHPSLHAPASLSPRPAPPPLPPRPCLPPSPPLPPSLPAPASLRPRPCLPPSPPTPQSQRPSQDLLQAPHGGLCGGDVEALSWGPCLALGVLRGCLWRALWRGLWYVEGVYGQPASAKLCVEGRA